MGIPLRQKIRIGSYIVRQSMRRGRRYPLVLEPFFNDAHSR